MPMKASDSGPDSCHRMNRNEISVATALMKPSSSCMV